MLTSAFPLSIYDDEAFPRLSVLFLLFFVVCVSLLLLFVVTDDDSVGLNDCNTVS